MRCALSRNGGRSHCARTLVSGEGADARHACSRRLARSDQTGPRTGGGNTRRPVRGTTRQEPCSAGAGPRRAPVVRGTERFLEERTLAPVPLAEPCLTDHNFLTRCPFSHLRPIQPVLRGGSCLLRPQNVLRLTQPISGKRTERYAPWVDKREKIDIIRDRLEDRALTMA